MGRTATTPIPPFYTFNSFSLDLVAKPLFFISLLLLFYISLYFYFYSFLFFFFLNTLSVFVSLPPFCCSLREPAGEVASGHKLEGCNHMLDIFMEDVRACVCVHACMQVLCVCVCREKARGDV